MSSSVTAMAVDIWNFDSKWHMPLLINSIWTYNFNFLASIVTSPEITLGLKNHRLGFKSIRVLRDESKRDFDVETVKYMIY